MIKAMFRAPAAVLAMVLVAGCVPLPPRADPPADATAVSFPNATPKAPLTITGGLMRPAGAGPFAAVVLLHGCHGVSTSTYEWARWLRDRGYVALVVDSWATRGMDEGCTPKSVDLHYTERFSDAMGALTLLQARPDVDRARIGAIGWSNGGAFAMAVVNGASLERARGRGLTLPEPGYQASVAFYPGGCRSIVKETVVKPLLILIGGSDDWTYPAGCREMVDAHRSRGGDATLVVYPGAFHYFDVVGQPRVWLGDVSNDNLPNECCGATVGYDAAAASAARNAVREFFERHLGRK